MLRETSGTAEEILKQVCESSSVQWSVQQGGLFFCGKDEKPPVWTKISDEDGWSPDTIKSLNYKVSDCFGISDLDAVLKHLSYTTRLRIVLDSKYKDHLGEDESNLLPMFDIKFADALFWICYYTDSEWTLRKGSDGTDEIYVTPKAAVPLKTDSK